VFIWYTFPVLVSCIIKNLATLVAIDFFSEVSTEKKPFLNDGLFSGWPQAEEIKLWTEKTEN
jgi:hypothetical protein